MAEPENHTLHLLREIRTAIAALDARLAAVDAKQDRNFAVLSERNGHLTQVLAGEIATNRYAASSIEARFAALESRVGVLETDR